ncbi:MAG: pyridoxal-phosphate dependent enzyme, partial [Verrucomicrobiota bacterium]
MILPTIAQQKNPQTVPPRVVEKLREIGLWDVHPLNLFRISWKNEPVESGGGFNEGNWIEFPPALTGVETPIVGMLGKWFPTGAHKVGAAYGCLIPRLVTGAFDPETQKAVWPSTGNYCRGGAYDCALLGCSAVAILPDGMSRERFEWLREIGTDEIIATPGTESNVKEIYDKCHELEATRGDDVVIFNQFAEFGNAIWHYHVTGGAIHDVYRNNYADRCRLAGYVSATGSAGTMAAGDYLRTVSPHIRVAASEALQCPTLYQFGYGEHRIEGIGDKHIPWIHNIRNTDVAVAVDDNQTMQLMRLFNEDAGRDKLASAGIDDAMIQSLDQVGISGLCNLVTAIKIAKHFDMGKDDFIFTVLTDPMSLYASRIEELR